MTRLATEGVVGVWGALAAGVLLAGPCPAWAFEAPVDPCSVLTADQASTALDGKASAGRRVVASLCEWDPAAQAGGGAHKRLTLGFLSASAWEQTKAIREKMPGFTRTPITGLGEEAVFSANPVICTLQVRKGASVLDIHLYGFTADQAKSKEIALAHAALAKF